MVKNNHFYVESNNTELIKAESRGYQTLGGGEIGEMLFKGTNAV